MLNDATCFKAVYIVCGYTDLRSGMDQLAALIEAQTGNRPYAPDTLYLFCGQRADRIKGCFESSMTHLVLEKICSPAKKGAHFHPPYQVEPVRSLRPPGGVLDDNVLQPEVQPLFYEDVSPSCKRFLV